MDYIKPLWNVPHDAISDKLPSSIEDQDKRNNIANILTAAGYGAIGYGVYKIMSNKKTRSTMSREIKRLSRDMSSAMSGNMFGKRRRRSRKCSKKQKKMRRSLH